ncbi:MAG: DUF4249 domain-containing protein [Salinivirgaceae bacterium]|nr:DUF4249 domain-containing protein [Salinivirgaceae bacterium]
MNKFREIISILTVTILATVAATGCYEPSDSMVFGNVEKLYVVEGRITNADSVATVVISKSVNADGKEDYEYVDNAIVWLRDDQGNSALLENSDKGYYQTSEIKGAVGRRYLLTVEIDGRNISAIDKMPVPASADSIVVEYKDSYTIFDTIGYYVSIYSTQSDDTLQYYRVEVEKNGKKLNDYSSLWLFEDAHLSRVFKMTIPQNFVVGDSVVVSICSLSEPVYEYFFGLSKQFKTNFSNTQPPFTNPVSNLAGNSETTPLGYFQASSVLRFSFVITNNKRTVVVRNSDAISEETPQ